MVMLPPTLTPIDSAWLTGNAIVFPVRSASLPATTGTAVSDEPAALMPCTGRPSSSNWLSYGLVTYAVLVAHSDAAGVPGRERTASTTSGEEPPTVATSTASARRSSVYARRDASAVVVCT